MKQLWSVLAGGFMMATLTLATALTPLVMAALHADPERGGALYFQYNRAACHGDGAGGGVGPNGEEGPRIAGLRMDFGSFLAQVRAGATPMPAFPDMSEEDATDLYEFLQSP
ncbi:MAG: cytochrome c [Dehalococcoidia bacterium]|nr:cytochrome c [Dehalococcoidia bacterium]